MTLPITIKVPAEAHAFAMVLSMQARNPESLEKLIRLALEKQWPAPEGETENEKVDEWIKGGKAVLKDAGIDLKDLVDAIRTAATANRLMITAMEESSPGNGEITCLLKIESE